MSNCIALSTEVLVNIHMRVNGFWQKPIRRRSNTFAPRVLDI